jgi:1,4-alpha-glucan branching enzyme
MDPFFRKNYQDKFSFSMMYYYDENFMLPLSHDEVVHGKSPMLYKMPGDEWQKFANLRALYTYMWTHPGAKLLFMGNEIGQTSEWNYKSEIQWHLLEFEPHKKMQACIKALNLLLKDEPSLYQNQFNKYGFEWVNLNHKNDCVIVYKRSGREKGEEVLVILNLNPVPKKSWQVTVSRRYKQEIFSSDSKEFWGTGEYRNDSISCELINKESGQYKLVVDLPPLSGIVLK